MHLIHSLSQCLSLPARNVALVTEILLDEPSAGPSAEKLTLLTSFYLILQEVIEVMLDVLHVRKEKIRDLEHLPQTHS